MEREYQAFSKQLAAQWKYYLSNEKAQLAALLPQLHGFYLVQLGVFDHYDLGATSTIPHLVYAGKVENDHPDKVIESNLTELPFQYESVDVLMLPHTLEFAQAPDKLLNEIYNILIPGGKLLLLGFNPFSLVGLTKLIKSDKNSLWQGNLHSISHVKFWLQACGFSVEIQKTFCFRPPIKDETLFNKLAFLEPLGQFCMPYWGSVYLIVAQKKMMPLSPIRKRVVNKKIRVTRGIPEPSTNKSM